MLDFILKYTWIGMLVLVYVIWGIVSVKDIIKTKRAYHSFNLDYLEQSTLLWIMISVIVLFLVSFVYWLCTYGGMEVG